MQALKVISTILLLLIAGTLSAQNIFVQAEQELRFGEFYIAADGGGTIRISNNGERFSSGGVHLLSHNHSPAIFNISSDSRKPVKIEIELLVLNMSNGKGKEMIFQLNKTESSIFILEPGRSLRLSFGGVLQLEPGDGSTSGQFIGEISLRANIYRE